MNRKTGPAGKGPRNGKERPSTPAIGARLIFPRKNWTQRLNVGLWRSSQGARSPEGNLRCRLRTMTLRTENLSEEALKQAVKMWRKHQKKLAASRSSIPSRGISEELGSKNPGPNTPDELNRGRSRTKGKVSDRIKSSSSSSGRGSSSDNKSAPPRKKTRQRRDSSSDSSPPHPRRRERRDGLGTLRNPDLLVDHAMARRREPSLDRPVRRARLRGEPLRPVHQIEPTSYLGRAFRGIGERGGAGDPPSSPSSSGSSSSRTSSATRSSSSGSSSTPRPRKRHRLTRSHRRRRSRRHRRRHARDSPLGRSHPQLKPREPEVYDGRTDINLFHRFIQQSTDYIDGYALPQWRQVSTLSYFLKDKAYEFYVNTVSRNPRSWTLRRFFIELFNYCFPIDFRSRMREKLDRFRQGDRPV